MATIDTRREVTIIPAAELDEAFKVLEALSGHPRDPNATADRVRQLMIDEGIDPEANEFSRDIMRTRGGR